MLKSIRHLTRGAVVGPIKLWKWVAGRFRFRRPLAAVDGAGLNGKRMIMAGKTPWSVAEFKSQELKKALQEFEINRTMYVDEFSNEDEFEGALIKVENTSELFSKIPAVASVELETLSGDMDDTRMNFKNLKDFGRDNIIQMTETLREQSETADLLDHFLKLFGKGKKWEKAFQDPESRAGFVQKIDAVLELLEKDQ